MRLRRLGLGTMLAAVVGAALGAGLLHARSVTGVFSWTVYGAVSGAFLGAALAAGAIRSLTLVTTSLGAILPAATLHLNACDATVVVVPMGGLYWVSWLELSHLPDRLTRRDLPKSCDG